MTPTADDRARVAVCITGLEVGGAETLLAKLLEQRPEDIEVRVFALIDGGEIAERIRALDVEVTGLHMQAGRPNLRSLFALTSELRRYRPDILHTWLYHADLLGSLAAKMAGVPHVIWHLHNSDLTPERVRIMTRLVVRMCALLSYWIPDAILSCSEAGIREHRARGYASERMRFLPNGVDAEDFRPDDDLRASVLEEFGLDGERPVIGFVARIDPQKNHKGFFEAVRLFFERGGDADFVLVGRGVTADDWQLPGWRDETGRPERVHLAGPRTDVARIMSAFDVATSASLGEAFPMVLIESMSCGAPCVATDVGDCARIVADTGLVVPPDDADALAAAWARILSMPAHERGELERRARERVLANYTLERFSDQIWSLYRETGARG
jgi:glycosyltransferase involved in cell wall biosynthesis